MNTENDHDYFNCIVMLDTPGKVKNGGAYYVQLRHNDAEHWVPKTLCDVKPGKDGWMIMEVERWFAQKEGMNA